MKDALLDCSILSVQRKYMMLGRIVIVEEDLVNENATHQWISK